MLKTSGKPPGCQNVCLVSDRYDEFCPNCREELDILLMTAQFTSHFEYLHWTCCWWLRDLQVISYIWTGHFADDCATYKSFRTSRLDMLLMTARLTSHFVHKDWTFCWWLRDLQVISYIWTGHFADDCATYKSFRTSRQHTAFVFLSLYCMATSDSGLLLCGAVSLGEWFLTFIRNIGKNDSSDKAASHPRSLETREGPC